MTTAVQERIATDVPAGPRPPWRELVWPKEHGSWSLAFEPLALGLLVAPSVAGGFLAAAVAAAFFARRPLRIAWRDHRTVRRGAAWRAVIACVSLAAFFFLGALRFGGVAWTPWLAPSFAAGAAFLYFDLRNSGREQAAEIAGSAAFSFLPAALAVLGGWSVSAAGVLAFVMLGRSVPTILCVRACLRAAKTRLRQPAPALAAAVFSWAVALVLVRREWVPATVAVLFGLFVLRSVGLLVFPRPAFRARTLGIAEAVAGVLFVACAALAWRF